MASTALSILDKFGQKERVAKEKANRARQLADARKEKTEDLGRLRAKVTSARSDLATKESAVDEGSAVSKLLVKRLELAKHLNDNLRDDLIRLGIQKVISAEQRHRSISAARDQLKSISPEEARTIYLKRRREEVAVLEEKQGLLDKVGWKMRELEAAKTKKEETLGMLRNVEASNDSLRARLLSGRRGMAKREEDLVTTLKSEKAATRHTAEMKSLGERLEALKKAKASIGKEVKAVALQKDNPDGFHKLSFQDDPGESGGCNVSKFRFRPILNRSHL